MQLLLQLWLKACVRVTVGFFGAPISITVKRQTLQWTVCLWNLALVGWLQIVHGQNAVDEYFEMTQIFTGNRFQPLGFSVCLLCVVLQSCTSWSFKCLWYTIGAGSEQHYEFLLCRKLHDFFLFQIHVLEWTRIKLKFPQNKILYRKTAGE